MFCSGFTSAYQLLEPPHVSDHVSKQYNRTPSPRSPADLQPKTMPSLERVRTMSSPTQAVAVQTEEHVDHFHDVQYPVFRKRTNTCPERPVMNPITSRSRTSISYDRELREVSKKFIKPTSLEDFKHLIKTRREESKSFRNILNSFDQRFSIIQEEPAELSDLNRPTSIAAGGTLV